MSEMALEFNGYDLASIRIRNNGAFVSVDVSRDCYDHDGTARHFGGFDSTPSRARAEAIDYAAKAAKWFSATALLPGAW